MTAEIIELDEIRSAKLREGRPEWFDLEPTGNEGLDRRRQALMDQLWEWPRAFRDNPEVTIHFHCELSPDDEEEVKRLRWQNCGLECIEQMRQRSSRFDDERFVEDIERALSGIREAAAKWREARKAGKGDSIVRKRRGTLTAWKTTLLNRMFRYGVRKLDRVGIKAIQRGALVKQIEKRHEWIASTEKDIARASHRLAVGVSVSGKNKGQPLTPMRVYSIEHEIKRDEARVAKHRVELAELVARLAGFDSNP